MTKTERKKIYLIEQAHKSSIVRLNYWKEIKDNPTAKAVASTLYGHCEALKAVLNLFKHDNYDMIKHLT